MQRPNKHLFTEVKNGHVFDVRDRQPKSWEMLIDYLNCASEGDSEWEVPVGLDVLSLRGQVIIDGNHLFLNCLRLAQLGFQKWNELARSPSKRNGASFPMGEECPFSPTSHRLLSYVAGQVMHRALDLATEDVALSFISDNVRIIASDHPDMSDPDWIRKNVNPSADMILSSYWEIRAFDAALPDRQEALKRISSIRSSRRLSNERKDSLTKAIERGEFNYKHGNLTFTAPYTLKNDYIDDLTKNHFARHSFGIKKIRVNGSGSWTSFYEKQVDPQLASALTRAAAEPELDWVCVISNDSDFVHAIDELMVAGKKVVWLCADDSRRRSKDLLSTVGDESSYSVEDLFNRFPNGESRIFHDLFVRPGIDHLYFDKEIVGGVDPEEVLSSLAPWDKAPREFQEEEDERMRREGHQE